MNHTMLTHTRRYTWVGLAYKARDATVELVNIRALELGSEFGATSSLPLGRARSIMFLNYTRRHCNQDMQCFAQCCDDAAVPLFEKRIQRIVGGSFHEA
jgi:hypothetical protein